MDGDDGLGILPSKEELAKKADAKPTPAPVPAAAEAPKKRGRKTQKEKDAEFVEPVAPTGTQMLVLKTQVGQERRVAEALGNKARRFGLPILGLLAPSERRADASRETTAPTRVEKGGRAVPYARALIKDPMTGQPKDTPFTEIAHFLT